MQLFTKNGTAVQAGGVVGRGGEGSVHLVVGMDGMLAKIYHKYPSVERIQKLEAMVTARTDELLKLACWPINLISTKPNGPVTGFLMPHAKGHKPVFQLYNPKARQAEYQNVNWSFLIHASTNIARAFATVHHAGHVIGDVNHSSVMVSSSATVRLIDCDSFQVTFNGRRYMCEVAEALHKAPELQGRCPKNSLLSPNHDNFGLAVLIFELLFMGRHPFAGKFAGGDLGLEEKIRTFKFAYGPNASARQMSQPPNTLPLAALSSPVAQLFERAFSAEAARDGSRPTARDWIAALTALQASLAQCSSDASHQFYSGLGGCPWCPIEAASGAALFFVAFVPTDSRGTFDLELVWKSIGAVVPPRPLPFPGERALPAAKPAPEYTAIGFQRRVLYGIGGVAVVGLLATSVLMEGFGLAGIVLAFVAAGIISIIASSIGSEQRRQVEARKQAASRRLEALRAQWEATASDGKFRKRVNELELRRSQYQDLPAHRQRELHKLESKLRVHQLHRFLDKYRIKPGLVQGVGAGRCATLASYGIYTAADVDSYSVRSVPGFGEQLTWSMVAWRKRLESTFQFNPAAGLDPRDVRKLDSDIANLRSKIEQELKAAPAELKQMLNRINAARSSLAAQCESALMDLAIETANVRAM